MKTDNHHAGSATSIDLARLEKLAHAAEKDGHHVYTHPRDSNKWRDNANWQHAADPATILALIALARATPQHSQNEASATAVYSKNEKGEKLIHFSTPQHSVTEQTSIGDDPEFRQHLFCFLNAHPRDTAQAALVAYLDSRAQPLSSTAATQPEQADDVRRLTERLKWMLDADQFRNVKAMLDAIIPPEWVYRSARELAVSIWRSNYKDTAPNWAPLENLAGVISQIDNMVAGMRLVAASEQQAGAEERTLFEAWASGPSHVTLSHVFSFTMHRDGYRYLEGTTELCWRAWLTALTHRATTAACHACNGTRCIPGPVGDPPSECEACSDQQPDDSTTAADPQRFASMAEGIAATMPATVPAATADGPGVASGQMFVIGPEAADQQGDTVSASGLPRWIDDLKGKDPTIDDLIGYIIAQQGAAQAQAGDDIRQHHDLGYIRESRAATPGAAQAQAGELERDAERYRWLRHADLDALAVGNWGTGQVYEGVRFDDAIDAAMAAPATGNGSK